MLSKASFLEVAEGAGLALGCAGRERGPPIGIVKRRRRVDA